MIPVTEALDLITKHTERLGVGSVEIGAAVGRVLAEDIIADSDLPPFDRSQMDGFAIRSSDLGAGAANLKIVGESAAGRGWHHQMDRGEAVRIMTGAPVPDGADSVQKLELAEETGDTVSFNGAVTPGLNIVPRGSEARSGDVVIKCGEIVSPNMISTIAAFGYGSVKVASMPRAAIMSTGTEIVEIEEKPGLDQIRNSNSAMLQALSAKCGSQTRIFPVTGDDLDTLRSRIADAAENADILMISGGVSVGKYDLTKVALRELGADIHFEKVCLKPGKPAVFATLGKVLVFGLPGNPVSAAVTFYLFVRLAAMLLQGAAHTRLRRGFAQLAAPVRAAKTRDTYLPAKLRTNDAGMLIAEPARWQGSSDFIGFAEAESLIVVPQGKTLDAGDVAEIVFLA